MVPAVTPVILPVVVIVPTPVVALLHAPPAGLLVNVLVCPVHIVAVPLILPATGALFTVTTFVAALLPQPFVIV